MDCFSRHDLISEMLNCTVNILTLKKKSGYQYDYKAFLFYCLNIVFLSFEEVSEVGTDRSTSTNLVTVIAVLSVLLIICSVVSFTTGRSQSS